jgi:ubiquinone/menaquinone biosynthesis C-methylase UbiE
VPSTSPDTRTRDDRHFDRWSRRYDRSPTQTLLFQPVQRSVVAALSSRLPHRAAVLDIGCGTGRLLERLDGALPGVTLVGLDRVSGMLAAARHRRAPLLLARGTAEQLPYRDATFDAVLTTVSFHHWSDKRAAIAEVFRVLKPAGLFALTDVSPDDAPGWLPFVRRSMHDMPSVVERERLITGAGFRIVDGRRTLHGRWIPLTIAERPAP